STPLAGGVDGELPNAMSGQPYTATIVATGGAGGYTFSASFLPASLAIDPQTGVISGIFTFGPGRFSITVTATDTNGISYSRRFAIHAVATPAVLPSVSPGDRLADCTFGWPCLRTLFPSSGAAAPFTWSATGLPPGMSLRFSDPNGAPSPFLTPGDAELWGAPTELGDFNVTVTLTDATGAQGTNAFPLHVSELELNSFLTSGTYGTGYSEKLRIIGGDLGYTAAIVNPSPSSRLPLGLALNSATQVVSGTPLETGSFFPDLLFTDSATPNAHTLHLRQSIFIAGPGNSTIQINHNGDLGTWTAGSTLNATVVACCLPLTTWSIVGGTAPANLTLTPQPGSNNVQLTAPSLQAGTYTFVLKVENANDPNNFAVRQFTLNVTTLTFPPAFPFNLPFGNVGVPYSQQLQINGAIGSPSWSVAPYNYLPPGLSLTSAGLLSGTPTGPGQFGFLVTVVDTAGNRASVFLNLAIYPQGQTAPLFLNLSSAFGPLVIGQFTIQFNAQNTTGGVPPYHYSLSPGANVIPGMRVQDGPPLPTFFSSSAFGGFIGVIESPGVYTTSIRVTDSANPPHTFDRPITLTVSPLTFVSQSQLPRAQVNTSYSFTFTATGGSGSYSWSATNLPNGITIDAASGELHGTPAAAGTSFPIVTVTDDASHESLSVGFTLLTNAFGITTPGVLPVGTQGTPYSVQLAQLGCSGTCTWSVLNNALPAGLTISSDGLISGTPTAPFNSFFTVRLASATQAVDKVMSLIIRPSPPQALSITNAGSVGPLTVGSQFGLALSARGGTPPYSWSLDSGTLPPGTRVVASGDAESSSFAPGVAYVMGRLRQVGTYSFTLRVTDAVNASATRTFMWIVSGINQQYFNLPLTNTTLIRGASYSQFLLALGGSGQYTWSATMPAGLTLNAATGEISGTPLDSGFFSVPVTVSDGAGRTITNFISMNIGGGTGVVTFAANSRQGPIQQGFSLVIPLNPTGGTPPYTVTALTPLPPGFAIQSPSAGSGYTLTGTPLAAGTFTFTLSVQDSASNVGQRTFTLVVSPIGIVTNTGLLQGNSVADGSVDVPYSQQLVAGSTAGAVQWSVNTALPAGLTLSSAGLLSGTPTAAGTYSFSVNVTDVTSGVVFSSTYAIRISPLAISAPALLPIATALEPYTYTFAATGATGAVTWSLDPVSTVAFGLTLSPDGTLSGTPGAGGTTSQLIVTATDSANNSITRRFNLFVRTRNVPPPTFAPVATTLPDVTVGQVFNFALVPSGGLAPFAWSVAPGSSLPAGLALLTGAALPPSTIPGFTLLAGQPTQAGQFVFDLIVTDSQGRSTARTFRLNVSPISILIGNLPLATVDSPYSAQLTAVGGVPPYVFTLTPTLSIQPPETLPPGLAFSPSGVLSGTPTATGRFFFIVRVQDAAGHSFARNYSLAVNSTAGLTITSGNPADVYVGSGFVQNLFTNGPSTYSWTIVSGSLPPGVSIGTNPQNPALTALVGQPKAPGLFTYTLRATDTADGSNVADRLFRFNVAPMQITSPPVTILIGDLPPAHVGVLYSTIIKAAGGSPPYTFAMSPATPLLPGLTLGADGTLSGTPTQNGSVPIAFVITDAAARTLRAFALTLSITPADTPPALIAAATTLGDASVGVPYQFALVTQRGGVAPFRWSVASGSSLPAGLAIVSGSGSVSDYLAGVPTTLGVYTFSLDVADSSGQTQSVPFTLRVSPIALTPNSIPSGRVGTAYSVSLVPSGGTGPYTIKALPNRDMPPGLSLVGATLSGTPAHAGSWLIRALVTDSATPPNTLSAVFEITIDNALGEAPAVTFGQRSIQITYVQGSPAPAPVAVSVGSTSGAIGFDVAIEGLPGATLSTASGTAPSSVSLDVHANALAAGAYSGVLALKAPGAANVIDAVPVLVTVVTPPPCAYTIAPTAGSISSRGGRGNFTLNTAANCAWSASASASWITITNAPPNGSGAATIGYSVALNSSPTQRSGTITVGGQTYTLTQFGS
ncbi:MAG TPA: putative Ig domain-containing protein, partial [Vicinamibacterales bacterium]|nr:putative Ig domain-containing protein [Vicinamibacterales bacterium]